MVRKYDKRCIPTTFTDDEVDSLHHRANGRGATANETMSSRPSYTSATGDHPPNIEREYNNARRCKALVSRRWCLVVIVGMLQTPSRRVSSSGAARRCAVTSRVGRSLPPCRQTSSRRGDGGPDGTCNHDVELRRSLCVANDAVGRLSWLFRETMDVREQRSAVLRSRLTFKRLYELRRVLRTSKQRQNRWFLR